MKKLILIFMSLSISVIAFADHHEEAGKAKHPNHKRRIAQGSKSGALSKEEIQAMKNEKKAMKKKHKEEKAEMKKAHKEAKQNARKEKQESMQEEPAESTADHIKKIDNELEADPLEEEGE